MKRDTVIAIGVVTALGVVAAFDPRSALIAAALFLLAALLAYHGFEVGLTALVVLAPLLNLRLLLPPFREGFLVRFFPDGIDLQAANVVALALLAGFAGFVIWRRLKGRSTQLRTPGLGCFGLFFISALLSIQNADDTLLSFKYVLFPLLFTVLAYVYLPLQVVRSRRTLRRMITVAYAVALVAAFLGVLSFVLLPATGFFRRATLLGFGTFAPFGTNHNLLAETLIAAFPLGFAVAARMKDRVLAFWTRFSAWIMVAVAILTFARTAWVAVLVQAVVLVALAYRHRLRALARPAFITALCFSPVIAYMIAFSTSHAIGGSTAARLVLTNFSFFTFQEHPLIGAGAGTFVERLGSAREFVATFGVPLDAHGFVQKIIAEQGGLGIITFALLIGWIMRTLFRAWKSVPVAARGEKTLLLMMLLSVSGSFAYQLFNTSYYNAKLWLPVGLALTAVEIVRRRAARL